MAGIFLNTEATLSFKADLRLDTRHTDEQSGKKYRVYYSFLMEGISIPPSIYDYLPDPVINAICNKAIELVANHTGIPSEAWQASMGSVLIVVSKKGDAT